MPRARALPFPGLGALLVLARPQALSADTAVHWLNRALCYIKLQQWEQALADSTRALALEPNSPRALYYQGLAHLELGRWADGIASLKTGACARAREREQHSGWHVAARHAVTGTRTGGRAGVDARAVVQRMTLRWPPSSTTPPR